MNKKFGDKKIKRLESIRKEIEQAIKEEDKEKEKKLLIRFRDTMNLSEAVEST